jgi:hypothetical protein
VTNHRGGKVPRTRKTPTTDSFARKQPADSIFLVIVSLDIVVKTGLASCSTTAGRAQVLARKREDRRATSFRAKTKSEHDGDWHAADKTTFD